MSLGPVMLDLESTTLSKAEQEILCHPLVGGVILFSRNYTDPAQLAALTSEIHALRTPPLLIGVDHEGGRVQRFRKGFSRLPACRCYGQEYDRDHENGLRLARGGGWLMAAELRAGGVDFSFAPVLDLDRGVSSVIGDRAFHSDPDAVGALAREFTAGMRAAGMAAVAKHFPGHGSVAADSHVELPRDDREFADIQMEDMLPFEALITAGLPAIMPAHVVFDRVDANAVGFSAHWIKRILRGDLSFRGAVFSDDLSMAGAAAPGDIAARATAALEAGCDMLLVCNDRAGAARLLEGLDIEPDPASQVRLMRMHGAAPVTALAALQSGGEWQAAASAVTVLDRSPELEFDDDDEAR